ncbi:MAG: hypothetical protein Q7S22_06980 [Candidatus Micrarchaeota archaeon]|nr:hypothetical protein [Candidatus Micrarchaeota archaeon]
MALPLSTQGSSDVRHFWNSFDTKVKYDGVQALTDSERNQLEGALNTVNSILKNLTNPDKKYNAYRESFIGAFGEGYREYDDKNGKNRTIHYEPTPEFFSGIMNEMKTTLADASKKTTMIPKPIPSDEVRALNAPDSAYLYLGRLIRDMRSAHEEAVGTVTGMDEGCNKLRGAGNNTLSFIAKLDEKIKEGPKNDPRFTEKFTKPGFFSSNDAYRVLKEARSLAAKVPETIKKIEGSVGERTLFGKTELR